MMRRLLQPFLVLLALIFLIEAWLWDHLEPIVARVVALIPLRAFKAWLAACVNRLSPAQTLVVFAIPLLLLFPLKLVEVWLLTHHYWIAAIALIVASKFIGLGVLAFIFDVTRSKLLQLVWFRRLYELILDIRRRAGELVAPVTARIKSIMTMVRSGSSSRWLRMIQRMRSRAHAR
ncbi:hypothetical protein [Rhodopseudomonas sp. P2A-2r]|uniref:hypothetical protein n=1 Tax=unclassified Rhodopseudomonas TaxID=2638247 RepID=UPI0022347BD1|nr:hypothetical protein [Rhodopseudomonas sp. P2A-2r]UZE49700.1 hypothetical protein ONR75_02485 [Rhodopseudomonas sp. P2A-2r]